MLRELAGAGASPKGEPETWTETWGIRPSVAKSHTNSEGDRSSSVCDLRGNPGRGSRTFGCGQSEMAPAKGPRDDASAESLRQNIPTRSSGSKVPGPYEG
jgi:hypothetical protein